MYVNFICCFPECVLCLKKILFVLILAMNFFFLVLCLCYGYVCRV